MEFNIFAPYLLHEDAVAPESKRQLKNLSPIFTVMYGLKVSFPKRRLKSLSDSDRSRS